MKNTFSEARELITALEQDKNFHQTVDCAANTMIYALKNSNKILWCGNGGSAADCQHLSAELVAKLNHFRPALASIALTADTSFLTAWINDTDHSRELFSRQVEALGKEGDILIAISTSGNSDNIIEAINMAKRSEMIVIALSGNEGGRLKGLADEELIVPSANTQRIQEMHIIIGHMLCEKTEAAFVK